MRSSFTFTRTRIIAIVFTLCVVGIFLIAGTWYANAHNSSNTQAASAQAISKTPPKSSCGMVDARQGEPSVVFNGAVAANAETCFWQAYQQCQSTTLVFHQMAVDTGDSDTLWPVKQNGTCLIADQSSHFSVSVRRGNSSSFTTCTQLQKTQQGLLLSSCGKKADLLVTAPASQS